MEKEGKGVVCRVKSRSAVVMTPELGFVEIRKRPAMEVGREVTFDAADLVERRRPAGDRFDDNGLALPEEQSNPKVDVIPPQSRRGNTGPEPAKGPPDVFRNSALYP